MATPHGPTARLAVALALVLAGSPVYAGNVAIPAGAGGVYSVPVTSLKETRFKTTLRQQYDFSCGSAALAALLRFHYDHPVTEQEVFQSMYDRGDQEKIARVGFSLLDMKRYLASIGYQADGLRASLDDLQELAVPGIVLIDDRGYRHFVVVKGLSGDRVLIGDPSSGLRAIRRDDFEPMWNGIAFVIRDQVEAARDSFNPEADWLLAASAPLATSMLQEGLASRMLLLPVASDF